jgi:hypothetical protein
MNTIEGNCHSSLVTFSAIACCAVCGASAFSLAYAAVATEAWLCVAFESASNPCQRRREVRRT